MFFILSKILFFLIQPINWVIGLMLFSLLSKKRERKRKALLAAVVMTLFFTNHFIFNQVVKWWEVETITADEIIRPYKVGILLGGYSNGNIVPNHDRHNFSQRGNRFFNAFELYKTGKIEKILLTGGTGDLLEIQKSEALMVVDFLKKMGVPDEDVIVEPDSRNTHENAIFSKKILEEKNIRGNYLLITSAWHMRRSQACFDKVDISYTPFSVDFVSEKDRWSPDHILLPDRNGFYYWEMLIKEWVGLMAYWVKGYI